MISSLTHLWVQISCLSMGQLKHAHLVKSTGFECLSLNPGSMTYSCETLDTWLICSVPPLFPCKLWIKTLFLSCNLWGLHKIILVNCCEKYITSYNEESVKAIYKKRMKVTKWWVYLMCIRDKVSFKQLPGTVMLWSWQHRSFLTWVLLTRTTNNFSRKR